MSDSLIPVSVACPCPGTPHADGDTVFLAPKLGFVAGVKAESRIIDISNGSNDADEVRGVLLETYLLDGVREWTFTNGVGDIPVTQETIRSVLLSDYGLAAPIAEAADTLYSKAVLDPLLARLRKSSLTSQTRGSTSPKAGSSAARRKRSKPSSTTTSPTAAIGTT